MKIELALSTIERSNAFTPEFVACMQRCGKKGLSFSDLHAVLESQLDDLSPKHVLYILGKDEELKSLLGELEFACQDYKSTNALIVFERRTCNALMEANKKAMVALEAWCEAWSTKQVPETPRSQPSGWR
jgi:hypothetical protein